MKRHLLWIGVAFFMLVTGLPAQQQTMRKAVITDSISVPGAGNENFALYLPSHFSTENTWPLLFVFDVEGRGRQSISMFRDAAESEGFVLAASNSLSDTLSILQNMEVANRMLQYVFTLIPIQRNSIYTAGFGSGGQMSTLATSFIKEIRGVISLGAAIPNTDILSEKNPFYFVGITGLGDYQYPTILQDREVLEKKRFPNQLLTFEGGHHWPPSEYLIAALRILRASAPGFGESEDKDEVYRLQYLGVDSLVQAQKLLRAERRLEDEINLFDKVIDTDSLKDKQRSIRRDKVYKAQKRNEQNFLFKETLLREDYTYYLEEDIQTYNFNNLGWWNYQMELIDKHEDSALPAEHFMGMRLKGYLNALVDDYVDIVSGAQVVDEDALSFLWMLKTITEPAAYENYLNIISLSSRHEDYGTALFYLEELLKNGYKDKAQLYLLKDTALLRITPEFNALIEKYLKDARYELIEE